MTLDDATSAITSIVLCEEDGTASSLRGLAETIEAFGLFSSLYTTHAETYREAETVLSGGALSKRFFHPLTVLALETGRLDFDPIFYGKDVSFDDIENIEVFPHPDVPIRDGTALVVVTFQHSGATHQLRYALQRVEGSDTWWIIDIFGSDWSLNKLLLQR